MCRRLRVSGGHVPRALTLLERRGVEGPRVQARPQSWRGVAASLLLVLTGCSRGGHGPAAPEAKPLPETEVPTTIVRPDSTESIVELFERARVAESSGDLPLAEGLYRQVIEFDMNGDYRKEASFLLGALFDRVGNVVQAIQFYDQFVREVRSAGGDQRLALAQVRLVRLLTFTEDYARAAAVADGVAIADRSPLEQVALHAARALGWLERGEPVQAEQEVFRGRAVLARSGLEPLYDVPLDVAALEYARGEIHRLRAESVSFVPLPQNFSEELERRCQQILIAQAAYSEVMRAKSAHYSAMAGVRVGELYTSLHHALMNMERPAPVDNPERAALFEGALRLRYAVLLRKATAMMQSTVGMIERTKEGEGWGGRAREALREIAAAEEREAEILASLPYSRAELETALDELGKRARTEEGKDGVVSQSPGASRR